jgi:perosamine synthetase
MKPRSNSKRNAIRFPLAELDLMGNEQRYVLAALREGGISSIGRHVEAFEQAFAATLGSAHAVAVTSGTAALHIALVALGIGPGDEVILPDLTYVATANAVRYTGASVVLVDVDPESWTIDPVLAERAVTRRTKAIIGVHLYGNPADLDSLGALAREKGLFLVEDAAQALGAEWRGKAVGSVGDAGCFSFYGNKVITTGEGGMVVTHSASLARRLRDLRDHAKSPARRYFHARLAFNYRMTALQAAVGLAQLERMPSFLRKRARVAQWYRACLKGAEDLTVPASFPNAAAVNWLFTFRNRAWTRRARDRCMARLLDRGVDSRPAFVPMSRLPMYRQSGFPAAAALAAQGISLPTHTNMEEEDVAAICRVFRNIGA